MHSLPDCHSRLGPSETKCTLSRPSEAKPHQFLGDGSPPSPLWPLFAASRSALSQYITFWQSLPRLYIAPFTYHLKSDGIGGNQPINGLFHIAAKCWINTLTPGRVLWQDSSRAWHLTTVLGRQQRSRKLCVEVGHIMASLTNWNTILLYCAVQCTRERNHSVNCSIGSHLASRWITMYSLFFTPLMMCILQSLILGLLF